jgi:tRNA modification GTPase
MDLTAAEAVADLVAAETAAQRRQALHQLDGGLAALYRGWAARLTGLLAQQEALIDFPDEDLPPEVETGICAALAGLADAIAAHLDDERRGERLRAGLVFAVAGPPNAGKSTLVNALAGRDVAIVAATPGTTRDVLEVRVAFAGVPVVLLDTAGLRDTDDPVEAEGVRRARARAAAADLVIRVQAGGAADAAAAGGPALAGAPPVLAVATKADLGGAGADADLHVSALTGFGMARLRARLEHEARRMTDAGGAPPLTRARHRAALTDCRARLHDAAAAGLAEMRGEEMRLALRALGRITGQVGAEAVLDAVFSQFCIGK